MTAPAGCQSSNDNDPQLMVPCIASNLSDARGVVAVSFGNALQAELVENVLLFANFPVDNPDTSFAILPAAATYG